MEKGGGSIVVQLHRLQTLRKEAEETEKLFRNRMEFLSRKEHEREKVRSLLWKVDTPRFAAPDVLRTLRLTGRHALSPRLEHHQTSRSESKFNETIENEDLSGVEAFGAEEEVDEEEEGDEGDEEEGIWVPDGVEEDESFPFWKRPPSGLRLDLSKLEKFEDDDSIPSMWKTHRPQQHHEIPLPGYKPPISVQRLSRRWVPMASVSSRIAAHKESIQESRRDQRKRTAQSRLAVLEENRANARLMRTQSRMRIEKIEGMYFGGISEKQFHASRLRTSTAQHVQKAEEKVLSKKKLHADELRKERKHWSHLREAAQTHREGYARDMAGGLRSMRTARREGCSSVNDKAEKKMGKIKLSLEVKEERRHLNEMKAQVDKLKATCSLKRMKKEEEDFFLRKECDKIGVRYIE